MSWVLIITILNAGIVSFSWGTPVIVGEYPSIEACKAAAASAVYSLDDKTAWKPFKDGSICVQRPSIGGAR